MQNDLDNKQSRDFGVDCSSLNDVETLNRDLLRTDGFGQALCDEAPDLVLLSETDRCESLLRTLARRPPGPLWVFAYGSLIWNPAIKVTEARPGRVRGWHRSFCLSVIAGRGSPTQPGLVLGLDEGGNCDGIAYRIEEDDMPSELRILWRREMIAGSYIPRWIEVMARGGEIFGTAITFTINPSDKHYVGYLGLAETVSRLATACGKLGSSADYLTRTRDGLRCYGIHDEAIEELARLVVERRDPNSAVRTP